MKKSLSSALAFLFLMAALLLWNSPFRVSAQNTGQSGAGTIAQGLFNAVAVTGPSNRVRNIGQSAHYLSYCTGAGVTSVIIQLEASFDGQFDDTVVLASSKMVAPCSGNHGLVLQAGGYYQNVRANITTLVGGTVTASYSGTAGAISYASPGMGSGGPSSPVTCDASTSQFVANNGRVALWNEGSRKVVVCAYAISFNGATGAGTVTFSYSTDCVAGVLNVLWPIVTTANTPQYIGLGSGTGQLFGGAAANSLCVQNTSQASAQVTIAFAEL